MRRSFVLIVFLALTQFTSAQTLNDTIMTPDYRAFSLAEITPAGWLKQQLEHMQKGSTGHLDEIYDKLKNDNGWLGGAGDNWEETPYWLDGAVPLAWLLRDSILQKKVRRYIEWVIEHQRPSGYFGPITATEKKSGTISAGNCGDGEDWWPKMVMLKTLQQYYDATGDSSVIGFMQRYFTYQLNSLSTCGLGRWTEWSKARGVENMMIVCWLYSITHDSQLVKLFDLLQKDAYHWDEWFKGRGLLMNAAKIQDDRGVMQRHSVNVAMGIKDPAIQYLRTNDQAHLKTLNTAFDDLMTLHGLPMGIFSGDEDLHGNGLIQGTELCTIVETMFSLENAIRITGDVKYMDALERICFNALPAQTTTDYHYKQYFQLPNQVQVARGALAFSVTQSNGMSNVFGTRSGYTCCYTNMHQGWTKFAAQLWHRYQDKGIATFTYSPSQLKTELNGRELTITESTNYPFEDEIRFRVEVKDSLRFPWQLRIPSWCDKAEIFVNGKLMESAAGGRLITIEREWKKNDELLLRLPMNILISRWPANSRTVERGPIVYALKIRENWKKGSHLEAGDYFSIFPGSAWNFALLQNQVGKPENFQVKIKPFSAAFDWTQASAPVEILAKARSLPLWKMQDGILHQPVCDRSGLYNGPADSALKNITLIPYGCTKLRIVAFPVVKER